MGRRAVVDYTLGDGTFLPKGSYLNCNSLSIHRDARNYANPDKFDGFRFVEGGSEGSKPQMVATSNEFLTFGHGRHVWYAFRSLIIPRIAVD